MPWQQIRNCRTVYHCSGAITFCAELQKAWFRGWFRGSGRGGVAGLGDGLRVQRRWEFMIIYGDLMLFLAAGDFFLLPEFSAAQIKGYGWAHPTIFDRKSCKL